MNRHRLTAVTLIAVVIATDSLSKAWARHSLLTSPRHVLGPLWWRLSYNPGVAFSLSTSQPLLVIVLTSCALGLVALVTWQVAPGPPTWGSALLLGGGAANEIDRLSHHPARVTDFISVGRFPIFNVADSAITLGFLTLLWCVWRGVRMWRA